jgi:F420-non-reducing hydrogenase small subunit
MVKILLAGLAGDSGCQVAMLGLHKTLLDILSANELVFAPTLMDAKQIPDGVDVAIVEGGVRDDHEEHLVKEIREKSTVLIAIGSCACFGGIPGLANLMNGEDLLDMVYADHKGTTKGTVPRHVIVALHQKGLHSYVKVDYTIPGCPPEVTDIADVLTTLLKGEVPQLSRTQVCDECPRERLGEYVTELKRIHEEIPDPDRCLLEQGYLCLGPATRGGCGAPCPQAGNICEGCRGPVEGVSEQGLAMMDALTALSSQVVDEFTLERYTGMFHRFTYADSPISRLKRRFKK